MPLIVKTCVFPACSAEFRTDEPARQHCSTECRGAHAILSWAGRASQMHAAGHTAREIGLCFDVPPRVMRTRMSRLRRMERQKPARFAVLEDLAGVSLSMH